MAVFRTNRDGAARVGRTGAIIGTPRYTAPEQCRGASPPPNSECLDKLVLLSESHLRAAVREYLEQYRRERNHQGLGGQLILPPANLNRPGPIICRERLGGFLHFYDREAA